MALLTGRRVSCGSVSSRRCDVGPHPTAGRWCHAAHAGARRPTRGRGVGLRRSVRGGIWRAPSLLPRHHRLPRHHLKSFALHTFL
jgi:hypothetical protein